MHDLTIEAKDGFLQASARGEMNLDNAFELFTRTRDTAVKLGFTNVLVDLSSATGNLSDPDRYELGRSMAAYYRQSPKPLKVAVVGTPPLVNGFGARVAANRGQAAEVFTDPTIAVAWLRGD